MPNDDTMLRANTMLRSQLAHSGGVFALININTRSFSLLRTPSTTIYPWTIFTSRKKNSLRKADLHPIHHGHAVGTDTISNALTTKALQQDKYTM